jgi:hypothetical protein
MRSVALAIQTVSNMRLGINLGGQAPKALRYSIDSAHLEKRIAHKTLQSRESVHFMGKRQVQRLKTIGSARVLSQKEHLSSNFLFHNISTVEVSLVIWN